MKRNHFIRHAWLGAVFAPTILQKINLEPEPPLDKALVQEFVGTAHRNKDKVITMLEENPTLLNSAHDWGHGDFETALGAASHVGYIELVGYLVDNGAQTNIFTACVFGHLHIVKSILEAFPATLHAKGPHGFTILHHAIRGGENALEVKAYLESLGAVALKIPLH